MEKRSWLKDHGMILLAAMVVGPLAIPAAAIGSALADLFSGYALYAPATFAIKGLVALYKDNKHRA